MSYPEVLDEWETLSQTLAGKSLARYGDGEFKLIGGRDCISQIFVPQLQEELRDILLHPARDLLVGIPHMTRDSPKFDKWVNYIPRYRQYLTSRVKYASAFVTRPDSAPWINTPEFFNTVEALWRGRDVALVANGERSLTPKFLERSARRVEFFRCSYRDSYSQIDELYDRVMRVALPTWPVILCCGATATVLAHRLCRAGRHAIDLGHIGLFWRKNETQDL